MTGLWWGLWAAGAVALVWRVCRVLARAAAVCEADIRDIVPPAVDHTSSEGEL